MVWGVIQRVFLVHGNLPPCAWFGEFSFFQLPSCGIIFQRNFLRFVPPLWDELKERGKKRGWWKNDFKMAAAVVEKAENLEMRDEMLKNSVLVTQRSLLISHNNITSNPFEWPSVSPVRTSRKKSDFTCEGSREWPLQENFFLIKQVYGLFTTDFADQWS